MTLLLVGFLAAAAAQEPPGDDAGSGTNETAAESAAESTGEAAAEAEAPPEDEPMDDILAGPAAVVEEDPAIQATADEEFNPDEEISEDYPVPLPSDI